MIGLTEAQARCLDFIKRTMAENKGMAPSYEEIKTELGLASKSNVHRMIEALEEKGRIRRIPNRARAVEVIEGDEKGIRAYPTQALIAELARRGATKRLERMAAA